MTKKRERKWFEIKGQTSIFYRYAAQGTYQSVVFGIDWTPTKYGYANGGFTQEVKPGIFVKVGEGTQAMLRRQRKAWLIFVGAEIENQITEKQKAKFTEAITKRQEQGIAYKQELEAKHQERIENERKRNLVNS